MDTTLTDHLTLKQQRFIQEYAHDWNGTAAAIRAGYKPNSARQMAAENLSKPDIAEALQAYTSNIAAEFEVTTRRMVHEYYRVAFSRVCPVDYYRLDKQGRHRLLHAAEWTDEMRLMYGRVYETANGVSIRMRSRDHAMDMLCRYTGGFNL